MKTGVWVSNNRIGIYYVVGQFALLLMLFLAPHGSLWFLSGALGNIALGLVLVGLIITMLGIVSLGNSLRATPVPKESAELRTTGLYAFVRHPIYLGLIVLSIGLAIFSSSLWGIATLVALIVLLSFKARFEEKLLLQKFPGYADYASRVGRIIPGIGKLRH